MDKYKELGDRLATEFLSVGNDPDNPAQRIQYKGGSYADGKETNNGGMNLIALKNYFTEWLRNNVVVMETFGNE